MASYSHGPCRGEQHELPEGCSAVGQPRDSPRRRRWRNAASCEWAAAGVVPPPGCRGRCRRDIRIRATDLAIFPALPYPIGRPPAGADARRHRLCRTTHAGISSVLNNFNERQLLAAATGHHKCEIFYHWIDFLAGASVGVIGMLRPQRVGRHKQANQRTGARCRWTKFPCNDLNHREILAHPWIRCLVSPRSRPPFRQASMRRLSYICTTRWRRAGPAWSPL
jgi:hypothetical protein